MRGEDTRRKGECNIPPQDGILQKGCLGDKGEASLLKTFGMEGCASRGMVYGDKNRAIPEDYEGSWVVTRTCNMQYMCVKGEEFVYYNLTGDKFVAERYVYAEQ